MDFANESYVRLYTRKTATNRELGWEGRAVMHAMLGEFDRSGRYSFRRDAVRSISAVTEIPEALVRVALDRLVETETWFFEDGCIVWPTHPEAQTCRKSDRLRKQASRAWDGSEPDPVTSGHLPSPASPNVTLSLAQPSLTQPSSLPERASAPQVIPNGAGTRRPRWESFPEGWRWSDETSAAAAMEGVTEAQLAEHVKYWTPRAFSVPVLDLDGELRRAIGDIRKRGETERAKALRAKQAPARAFGGPALAVLEATPRHAAYAKKHGLDVGAIVAAIIEEGLPDKLGLGRARELIGERLQRAARAKAGAA